MSAGADTREDRRRILIVEDHDDFRLLLELTLREHGYAVDAVSHAEDGVRMLQTHRYDLVLCDYSLPGHSGVWFLSQLKQDTLRSEIPTVIVTADHDAPGIPADAPLIKKPVDFDHLLGAVRAMLSGSARSAGAASAWRDYPRQPPSGASRTGWDSSCQP